MVVILLPSQGAGQGVGASSSWGRGVKAGVSGRLAAAGVAQKQHLCKILESCTLGGQHDTVWQCVSPFNIIKGESGGK